MIPLGFASCLTDMKLNAPVKWFAVVLSLHLLNCTGISTYRDSLRLSFSELNSLETKATYLNDAEAAWLLYLHYSTFPHEQKLAGIWLDRAISLQYSKAIVFKNSLAVIRGKEGEGLNKDAPMIPKR